MTTIAESFNKADGDTLGPDLTWVEDQGDIDIVSNRARGITLGAAVARAAHSLAGNDQYSEIVAYTTADPSVGLGPTVRKAASATLTFYLFWLTYTTTYVVTMYKVVGAGFTALGTTAVPVTFADGDTLRIEANGTTIRGLINGVEVINRTDSGIASGAQTGIRFYNASGVECDADSFAAGDLTAAAASLIYFQPAIAPLLVR